jgi:hypothetical protein
MSDDEQQHPSRNKKRRRTKTTTSEKTITQKDIRAVADLMKDEGKLKEEIIKLKNDGKEQQATLLEKRLNDLNTKMERKRARIEQEALLESKRRKKISGVPPPDYPEPIYGPGYPPPSPPIDVNFIPPLPLDAPPAPPKHVPISSTTVPPITKPPPPPPTTTTTTSIVPPPRFIPTNVIKNKQ